MTVKVLKNRQFEEVEFDVNYPQPIVTDYALALLNRVVLQNSKQGTKKAKDRSDVNGTTAKPFRQKGTGKARQGSRKGPHMRGGGVAHGPKPDFKKLKLNKEFKRKLTKEILRKYMDVGSLLFVDLGAEKTFLRYELNKEKSLLVYHVSNLEGLKKVRNLPNLVTLSFNSISPLKFLNFNKIYFDIIICNQLVELVK